KYACNWSRARRSRLVSDWSRPQPQSSATMEPASSETVRSPIGECSESWGTPDRSRGWGAETGDMEASALGDVKSRSNREGGAPGEQRGERVRIVDRQAAGLAAAHIGRGASGGSGFAVSGMAGRQR